MPHGGMIARDDDPFAVRGKRLLRCTPFGDAQAIERPCRVMVDVLAPPSILAVPAHRYTPLRHESAG